MRTWGPWLSGEVSVLGVLPQEVIGEDQNGHGFDHGNGSGKDTRVVTAAGFELYVFALGRNGLLCFKNGRGRFKRHSEDNGFAIGNAALHASGAVGAGAHDALVHIKGIVVFGAAEHCPRKA